MKKFTLMLLGLFLAGTASVEAQHAKTVLVDAPPTASGRRCVTMEAIQVARQRDPQGYDAQIAARRAQNSAIRSLARTSTLSGPVTIPVVVHVVLSNPNIITEAQVDDLINRLNLDYAGTNADSVNGASFYSVRGHSKLRFARARRTPAGALTNGIERRIGLVQIGMDTYQEIKHESKGGLDPWNIEQYYNIWVGVGESGLLGIAPSIGKGAATESPLSSIGIDGVCIDYSVFSTGCFSNASYNMGRTVVHEIGHNFGLYHIFSGCTVGADFEDSDDGLPANLTGAAADDTPSQGTETSSCLTGTVPSDCGGVASKMYQNYMDYTDDGCYSMFTKSQVARMEYTLEFYRSGYLTSLGAVPPAGLVALDISPSFMLSPGSTEFNNSTCSITTYPTPFCAGNVTPRIEVTNRGTTTITSFTAKVQVNAGAFVSATATGVNITTGNTGYITLPAVALVTGTNTLRFVTAAPNGGVDGVAANDTMTQTIFIAPPIAGPIADDIEGATFPSAKFSIVNPNADTTWRRAQPGRSSTYSLFINNYDNDNVGSVDDFRSVPLAMAAGADSVVVSFDVAHRPYSATGNQDTLQVLMTSDCGSNYFSVYKKWGNASLATGPLLSNASYLSPTASEWRSERVAVLASNFASGNVVTIFRDKNRYGNNIFIDNINIRSTCKTTSFTGQPAAVAVCAGQAAAFSATATGNATLNYQWQKDGVNVAGATSSTYSIPSTAVSNAGNYTVVITNACGVASTSSAAALTVNTGGSCSGSAVSSINPDIDGVVLMPSIVRSSATVRVNAVRAMKIEWTVIDAAGSIVKRFAQNVSSGQNDIKVNMQELASGTYQLIGNSSKGKTNTIKFVRL